MALSREDKVSSDEWMAKSAAQEFKPALMRRKSARAERNHKSA